MDINSLCISCEVFFKVDCFGMDIQLYQSYLMKRYFSPLNCLCNFTKNKFQHICGSASELYSVSFISLSLCLHQADLIIVALL